MLPDRVSNPGPLTYESGALPIALHGPARPSSTQKEITSQSNIQFVFKKYDFESKLTKF